MTAVRPDATPDELREHFAKFDREDLGVVDEADAVIGWKTFVPLDRDTTGRTVWPPVLGGWLMGDTRYPTRVTTARCSGRSKPLYGPLAQIQTIGAKLLRQAGLPAEDPGVRFDLEPCDPPVTWGCPARCGLHSNRWLVDDRHVHPRPAVALVAHYGRVIRSFDLTDEWRSEYLRIDHLLLAEPFTQHPRHDALAGWERRYGVPITAVSSRAKDADRMLPLQRFVETARDLDLPAIHRPPGNPAHKSEEEP